jgi:hypothetical protein
LCKIWIIHEDSSLQGCSYWSFEGMKCILCKGRAADCLTAGWGQYEPLLCHKPLAWCWITFQNSWIFSNSVMRTSFWHWGIHIYLLEWLNYCFKSKAEFPVYHIKKVGRHQNTSYNWRGQQYHGTEPTAGPSITITGFILQVSLQGFWLHNYKKTFITSCFKKVDRLFYTMSIKLSSWCISVTNCDLSPSEHWTRLASILITHISQWNTTQ